MKHFFILSLIVLSSFGLSAQMSIAIARTQAIGAQVTVIGVVTNGPELGTIRYIQDATAGIAVYDSSVSSWERGDSVAVVGFLTDYNGLLEIENVVGSTVFTSGNNLPEPQVLMPDDLGESTESELVTINDVIFNDGGNVFASNTSYFFNADGQTGSIYVRSDHPLIGMVIPSTPVDITGISSQYLSDYQVILRDSLDIINDNSISIISKVEQFNISTEGFDLMWETDSIGTTGIFYGNTPELEIGKIEVPGEDIQHYISIEGADPSELFYIQAYSVRNSDTAFAPVSAFITQSQSTGDIKVYFTNSVDTTASIVSNAIYLDDAIDDTLISYINRAQFTLDIAVYDYNPDNLSDIAGAIDSAFNRGVEVRLILDTSWTDVSLADDVDPSIHSIVAPSGQEYGIMHHKFVVIDANATDPTVPIVWTGSTNFENKNINSFSNQVIILQDKSLAISYWLEFNEMWGTEELTPLTSNQKFGPNKINNTPHKFIINDIPVECYFSPSDGTNSKILECIESADENLYIETMLITRSDLGYAIADKKDQGLDVRVLVNDKGSCSTTVVSVLEQSLGTDFGENLEEGIMHNKFLVADYNNANFDPLVLTGSHNWSNSAENINDENTLIIHDQEIASWYFQEFYQRYRISVLNDEIIEQKLNWKVYPNPSFGDISVEVGSQDIIEQFEIYDINGRILYKNNLPEMQVKNISLQSLGLESGYYFIRVVSNVSEFKSKILYID